MTTVRIDPLMDGKASIVLPGGLSPEERHRLTAACRAGGSRKDSIFNLQVVAHARVADVIMYLERIGCTVAVHPDVVAAIEAARAGAREEVANVGARIESCLRPEKARLIAPYQREGAAWLSTRTRGILADSMGLGKTVQVVMALAPQRHVLVICPKIAIGTWLDHTEWRSDYRAWAMHGRNGFSYWPDPGSLVAVNFEILPTLERLEDLKALVPPGLIVVVDEAHLAKNRESKRGERVDAICKLARENGGASWLVTGTPLKNHPPDLYVMLQLAGLEEETWSTKAAFCRAFGGSENTKAAEWQEAGVDPDVPRILMRVMLRREKDQVLPQLPEKRVEHLTVAIPDDAKAIADEALLALAAIGIEVKDSPHEWACACLQCTLELTAKTQKGGIPFELLSKARAALAAAKVPALLEIVENFEAQQTLGTNEAGLPIVQDPFLLWSCHRAPIDAVVGVKPTWAALTGDVTAVNRVRAIETAFQAGCYRGLGLTVQKGGVSLTLTRASLAVFVDLPWTPSELTQAMDRIHRIGQRNACRYIFLVADHPLDRWLVRLLGHKAAIEAASVGAASVKAEAMEVGPAALPTTAAVAAAPDAKRPARADESDVVKMIEGGSTQLLRIIKRQMAANRGCLSEAQWAAATASCRGVRA